MKLFLITLFVGFAAAASLQNTYLPPNNAQTSGGHGSFLQGPHQSRPNQQYLPPGGQSSASFSHGSFSGGRGGQAALGSGGFGGGHGGQGGFGGGHSAQGGFGAGHAGQGGFAGGHGGQGGFGGGGHGGSSFGSQGSYSGGGGGGYGGHGSGQQIPILKYENSPNYGDGSYQFEYATGNGITQQEQGHLNNPGSDYAEQVVQGSYSYTGDDGQTYTVHYKADANGFQATGDHLPTPPPIPEAIQKSLAYNAAHAGSGGSGGYGGGSSGGFGGGSSGGFGGGSSGSFGGGSSGGFGGGHHQSGGRPQQQYLPPSRPSFNQNTGYQY